VLKRQEEGLGREDKEKGGELGGGGGGGGGVEVGRGEWKGSV